MSMVRQNGMNHSLRMVRLVDGSLVPVIRVGCGRIADRHDRLGDEAVVVFDDFVFLRLRLIDVAERALVDEGEMGVVEGVLHHSERRQCHNSSNWWIRRNAGSSS